LRAPDAGETAGHERDEAIEEAPAQVGERSEGELVGDHALAVAQRGTRDGQRPHGRERDAEREDVGALGRAADEVARGREQPDAGTPLSPAAACGLRAIWRSIAIMERVTGIGGVFQRAGQAASLRDWYAEHLGIDISDWGTKPFEWTPGGSTTWAIFDHDTEYFGRPEQAFMVNFRVADLDAMLAQLRSAGVEVIDALEESEYGRFGWAVDPEGTRFEIWEPPPGR
jgi:predicted enzyme related to lactoylglutathione lyase